MAPRRRAASATRTTRTDKAKTRLPNDFDHETARALGKLVQEVISDPSKRQAFRADPRAVARGAGLRRITPDVEKVMLTLAGMSPSELRLLSELNETLIKEGLYVETGNPPLCVF